MVSLRVPASSANLGPGFDCMAVAVNLWFQCRVEEANPGELNFAGVPPEYANEHNLLYLAYVKGMSHLGKTPLGLFVEVESQVPIGRGLGSSAALRTAGLAAAFLHAGEGLDKQEIFRLSAELEGHADNAAASVLGGLRVVMREEGRLYSIQQPISDKILFTALIPPFSLSTNIARAALPGNCSRPDAVYNLSHALMAQKALELADWPLIKASLRDKLHQPYRMPLIHGAEDVWQTAEQAGAVVYLSGAGPSLMCLYPDKACQQRLETLLPPDWLCQHLHVDTMGLLQD